MAIFSLYCQYVRTNPEFTFFFLLALYDKPPQIQNPPLPRIQRNKREYKMARKATRAAHPRKPAIFRETASPKRRKRPIVARIVFILADGYGIWSAFPALA